MVSREDIYEVYDVDKVKLDPITFEVPKNSFITLVDMMA
jgi:hypothetical protein